MPAECGVITVPSSPDTVRVPLTTQPSVILLLGCSVATDGFSVLNAPGTHAFSYFLGIAGFNSDGGIVNAANEEGQDTGTGSNVGYGTRWSFYCVALSTDAGGGSGKTTRATCTAIDPDGFTLDFVEVDAVAGQEIYWVAIASHPSETREQNDLEAHSDIVFSGFPTAAKGALLLVEGDGGGAERFSLGFLGSATASLSQACGFNEASASPGGRRDWFAPTSTGGRISIVSASYIVGLLSDWYQEALPRPSDGLEIQIPSILGIGHTYTIFATAAEEGVWAGGADADAATVDVLIGLQGDVAVLMGANTIENAEVGLSLGLSVPAQGFDVAVALSRDHATGKVIAGRFPDRSWVSGWDHSDDGDTRTDGTVTFPDATHMRLNRAVDGGAGIATRVGAWVIGDINPPPPAIVTFSFSRTPVGDQRQPR